MMLETGAPARKAFPPLAAEDADAALADPWGTDHGPRDAVAREALVRRYGHLVKYVVGRLGVSIPGVFDHEDAMQAGSIGLLQAVDAYRPDSPASFESYALLRIRGSILDAIRALDTVGRAGREAARAIERAMRDLHAELGRPPEEVEIARRLGVTIERYHERLQSSSYVTISLDELDPRASEDDTGGIVETLVDTAAPDPEVETELRDDVHRLARAIGQLGERTRMVLALYYQDGLTLREIGQVLGVTESRVCQIHAEAIIALRSRILDPAMAARLRRKGVRA
jgi:RNA polymerase sigma factor FliA